MAVIVDTALSGARWRTASSFVIFGFAAIAAAGLLAAVTASISQRQILWAIAYLVLVVGIAQIGLGAGQAWLAERPIGAPLLTAQFVAFNLGNAGVIGGAPSLTLRCLSTQAVRRSSSHSFCSSGESVPAPRAG